MLTHEVLNVATFWKCRAAAVLLCFASLARYTQPGYPWRVRGN